MSEPRLVPSTAPADDSGAIVVQSDEVERVIALLNEAYQKSPSRLVRAALNRLRAWLPPSA